MKNEALQEFKEVQKLLRSLTQKKANWNGHIFRINCLLKYVIEGEIEGTGRRGRRRKQPLEDHKGKERYWRLKEEALALSLWRTLWKRQWTCLKTDYVMMMMSAK